MNPEAAMNPVSLGMDGLLTLLLFAALAVGWRLNGKLKSLTASQAGFVKAVADLDLAAGRAEAGLEALRGATQEAHDTLLTRIETARTLAARLDRACEDAQAAAAKAEADARRIARAPVSPAISPSAPFTDSAVPSPASAAPGPPRLVEPPPPRDDAGAVLRLIESARVEAAAAFPALVPAAAPLVDPGAAAISPAPADGMAAAGDRLTRFVARRREARAR